MSGAGLPELVSRRVQRALQEHTSHLTDLGSGAAELIAAAADLLTGGKRLRASFCYAGWQLGGDAALEADGPVVLAGSALELFQAAALAHDDLIDASDTRRGQPTMHRRLARHHAEQGWLGDSQAHGDAGAILLGDLLLMLAGREMDSARLGVAACAAQQAATTWATMTSEVAVGQYLDVRSQAQPFTSVSVEASLRVVRAKSARYSVEHPLVLGAALSGTGPQQRIALGEIGLPLGIAFQLRDDALDVLGDPAATGKPIGADLREGKRTVLLALALARASETDRKLLVDNVGRQDLTETDVKEIGDLLQRCGALAAHETMIEEHLQLTLDRIEQLVAPTTAKQLLTDLAGAATRRDT